RRHHRTHHGAHRDLPPSRQVAAARGGAGIRRRPRGPRTPVRGGSRRLISASSRGWGSTEHCRARNGHRRVLLPALMTISRSAVGVGGGELSCPVGFGVEEGFPAGGEG